ncbi:MAG: Trx7/PDZ domain-containing (seleno)protein [Planctomycetota bacterium]
MTSDAEKVMGLQQVSRMLGVGIISLLLVHGISADDKGLKKRIADLNAEKANHWIYNDIPAGFAKAKESGKPLFITFRCVPCVDCLGFDAEVADGNDAIKELAREKFISVRQVEMKGVDLTQFQFDHDLNWAAMFLNADGTVYARYGTQSAEGADEYNSVKGLVATMNRVLELHKEYPRNKSLFVGKKPDPKPWKTAMQMPTLVPKLLKGGQTTRTNCIHCHNIHDAENELWQKEGSIDKDNLWRYPLPENIGLEMSIRDGVTVKSVLPQSVAAKAGIQSGQQITTANGQAIASIADLQWVMHTLPNEAGVKIRLAFADGNSAQVFTQENWKQTDISWRGSLWSVSPRLRVWAPPIPESKRAALNLAEDWGALGVKFINQSQAGGQAAVKAGLKNGDVIIKLDGKPVPKDNQAFNAYIKLNYELGQTVQLTVLRRGKEKIISLPLVE